MWNGQMIQPLDFVFSTIYLKVNNLFFYIFILFLLWMEYNTAANLFRLTLRDCVRLCVTWFWSQTSEGESEVWKHVKVVKWCCKISVTTSCLSVPFGPSRLTEFWQHVLRDLQPTRLSQFHPNSHVSLTPSANHLPESANTLFPYFWISL